MTVFKLKDGQVLIGCLTGNQEFFILLKIQLLRVQCGLDMKYFDLENEKEAR
jgi:hypothetical protein